MGADQDELVLQNLWLLIFIALVNVMSALGHKRTCAVRQAMSALPPKADLYQQHNPKLCLGRIGKMLRFSDDQLGTRSVNRTDKLKFNTPRPKTQIDLAQSIHWLFNDYVDQWIGPKPYTFLRW